MEKFILWLVVAVVNAAIFLVAAKLVVWGLATMHVHAGILGAWFILAGLSFVITTANRSTNN